MLTEEDENCRENLELGAKMLRDADLFGSSEGVKLQWDFWCSAFLIYLGSFCR